MLYKTQSQLSLIINNSLLIQNYFIIPVHRIPQSIEEPSTQGLIQPAVISTE